MKRLPAERSEQLMSFLAAIKPTWKDAIQDLQVIDEAMTHTSARLGRNHEPVSYTHLTLPTNSLV